MSTLPIGFGLTVDENTMALVSGVGVLISLLAFGQAFVAHDPMTSRLKSHQKRRDRLRAALLDGNPEAASRRAARIGQLKRVLDSLKMLRGGEAKQTSDRLAQAGWRSRDALVIFLALRLAMPIALAVAGWAGFLTLDASSDFLNQMIATLGGAVVGGFAPKFLLGFAIKRRQKRLKKQLPDGLDLLVICAEAGLSLDASLTRVAREIGFSAPDLADEFGLTAVELGFLPDRRQALANLMRRTDLPSIRGVVNTLIQTERYGTPLAHSLRVLSAEFREERMLKAEEKAAKLPAILTVPMIIFILPTLFIIILGPSIIQAIETFK